MCSNTDTGNCQHDKWCVVAKLWFFFFFLSSKYLPFTAESVPPAPPNKSDASKVFDPMTEDPNNVTLSLDNSNRTLSRQNAIYFNSDSNSKFQDVEDKYNISAILVKLDAKHPYLDFFQYEEALRKLNIYYLETANMLEPHFYESQLVGMTKEAAELFRQSVSKEYSKALLEHERAKMERRGDHNVVPVYFS